MKKFFLAFIVFLLAAGSVGSAHAFYEKNGRKYEDIDIMSIAQAKCILRRDGRLLLKVKLPSEGSGKYRMQVAHVDITESRSPINVSCARPGFRNQSTVISFSPKVWKYVNPPCVAANDEEAKGECRKAQADVRNIKIEYPEAVRLDLQPNEN